MLVFAVFAFLLCAGFLLAGLAWGLKKTGWAARRKKRVFALLAAFLFFPVLAPAGIMAAVPLPHVVFLGLAADLGAVIGWYGRTWLFCGVSYAVSAGFFYLLAQMIFFEYRRG